MSREWTPDELLALARGYQTAAVLAAAADLDLFSALASGSQTAADLAAGLACNARGLSVLLDALAALDLLEKKSGCYALTATVTRFLRASSPETVLPMLQHQANCLRRWAQLAHVVKTGRPAERGASVRGEQADAEAFLNAMHTVSSPVALQVVQELRPLPVTHVLDVGGASGTWTIAFLQTWPAATATLFDLPQAVPLATRRLAEAGLSLRVKVVAGDFFTDPLPAGADLAWVSAIVHQNSREQNRRLFANVAQALAVGGHLAIRDIVMDESRTEPAAGAFFAVNMLVATEGGGTFTFDELREDLESAGLVEVRLAKRDQGMNSLVVARKAPDGARET